MAVKIQNLRIKETSKKAEHLRRYPEQSAQFDADHASQFAAIEDLINATQDRGRLPLWDKYKDVPNYTRKPIGDAPKRTMNDVRTKATFCRFYSWLAATLAPDAIVEIGAAFGASGMYWLTGLNSAQTGTLFSFEPNPVWHPIARSNFDEVSDRHLLTLGTFEDNAKAVTAPANIALIDAIHTRDFVYQQLDLVRSNAASGALVLFDDINFSDNMRDCWAEIAEHDDWAGVWQLGNRVGMVELP